MAGIRLGEMETMRGSWVLETLESTGYVCCIYMDGNRDFNLVTRKMVLLLTKTYVELVSAMQNAKGNSGC